MKVCPNCGSEYADDKLNFCAKCGTGLVEKHEDEHDATTTTTPPPIPPIVDNGVQPPITGNGMQPPIAPKKKKGGGIIKTLILSVVVLAIGCFFVYRWVSNKATYLRLSPDQIIFTKGGGDVDVSIDYDGIMWKVNYVPSWCEVDEYDNSFSIHCYPNTTGVDREDYITISSGKILQQVYVGQHGHATYLNLSESSLSVDRSGGSIDITIDSDGSNFEVTGPSGYCSVSNLTDDGFTLSFPENDERGRSGAITVKDGDTSASISFYQKGVCFNCNGAGTVNCSWCGGSGVSYGFYGSTSCSMCGGTGKTTCPYCSGSGNE